MKRLRFTEAEDQSIRRGLRWLSESQKDSGAFGSDHPVAVTSLTGLAFMGYGEQYNRGRYGAVLVRAVNYLTDLELRKQGRGYIDDGASRMHGHAYAILFLSQVIGTIPDPATNERVYEVVRKGVELIAGAQTIDGGWGYGPGDAFDEASITVCCLQALRAAKDAGIDLSPLEPGGESRIAVAVRGAVSYLTRCCLEDGSFKYSLARGVDRSSYELTAAAVSTLDAAGEYSGDAHTRGVGYLLRVLSRCGATPLRASSNYPFYGNFYAAQVYHQLGGAVWADWEPAARGELIAQQNREHGYWDSKFGREYGTAMALLILEVPVAYLPMYER
ncbi:MAG: prenyltransferase/squalene oxidase repeat-containing protein [Planctomycetota bacterium]